MAEMIPNDTPGMALGSKEHRQLMGEVARFMLDVAAVADRHDDLITRYGALSDSLLSLCREACELTGLPFLDAVELVSKGTHN